MSCGVYNGFINCFTWDSGSAYVTYWDSVSSGGFGGSWTNTGSDYAWQQAGCVQNVQYFICVGGYNGGATSDVSYSAMSASGGFGAWTGTTAFPTTIDGMTSCTTQTFSGQLYIQCIDGTAVKYATLTGGVVGSWNTGSVYPVGGATNAICIPYTNSGTPEIICMGSTTGGSAGAAVYYETSIGGSWTATTSLTTNDNTPYGISPSYWSGSTYIAAYDGTYVWNNAPSSIIRIRLSVCLPNYQGTTAPSGTFSLAGTGLNATTISSGNSGGTCTPKSISSGAGDTVAVTVPADGVSTRYRMNGSATSSFTEQFSCSVNCAVEVLSYYEVLGTYNMFPQNPATWPGSGTGTVSGTEAGSGATCTISVPSGGTLAGCGQYFDFFSTVTMPTVFTAGSPPISMFPTSPSTFQPTVGSFTYITNYASGSYTGVIRLAEAFNFQEALGNLLPFGTSGNKIVNIFEGFFLQAGIGGQIARHILIAEQFTLAEIQCIVTFNCQLNSINFYNNPSPDYIANDNYIDQVLSAVIFPVLIVFAVIIIMRRWGNLNENSLIPLAMFTILMIAWAGQGSIFPQWLSLLVILITGLVLAYQVGQYFFGRNNNSGGDYQGGEG